MMLLKDILGFIFASKKYWMLPVLFLMMVFGAFIILTKGSIFAPIIYTVF